MKCRVCGTDDSDKPQIFKGDEWCCDRHRKIIDGEVEPTDQERAMMAAVNDVDWPVGR